MRKMKVVSNLNVTGSGGRYLGMTQHLANAVSAN
jgi:hypothetical protein